MTQYAVLDRLHIACGQAVVAHQVAGARQHQRQFRNQIAIGGALAGLPAQQCLVFQIGGLVDCDQQSTNWTGERDGDGAVGSLAAIRCAIVSPRRSREVISCGCQVVD